MKTKLLLTDSYYNTFNLLTQELKGKINGLENKNYIFCEEKISLFLERTICEKYNGTFNTEVLSFGRYLRKNKVLDNLLSKEGSVMAIKRILNGVTLKRFNKKANNLSKTLYDLIIQLKSAKISLEEIKNSIDNTDGLLKNKLVDIYEVYSEYEKYLKEMNFIDQSSYLNYVKEVIEEDEDIKNADIYLVGYSSWTKQGVDIIETLIKNCKSVTAILVSGENKNLYLCETENVFCKICKDLNEKLEKKFVSSSFSPFQKAISSSLFNPLYNGKFIEEERVYLSKFKSKKEEMDFVGQTIKKMIIDKKCRYKDISIALKNSDEYVDVLESVFSELDIPYFFDGKKVPLQNPLVSLIISYIEVFRKNFDIDSLYSFYKNPLVIENKEVIDDLRAYTLKYSINYTRFFEPFTFTEENLEVLEQTRKYVAGLLEKFNIISLLDKLNVKEKLENYSLQLENSGLFEESAVNQQIYDAVNKILLMMNKILNGVNLSYLETKELFLSGMESLELSILPQYNDAVFIGDYKSIALAKSPYLFAIGLNESATAFSLDTGIVLDAEIDKLNSIKVYLEPKIAIVNDRNREFLGLSLCSFSERLFITYCEIDKEGKKHTENELLRYIKSAVKVNEDFYYKNDYLTFNQSIKSFAEDIEKFKENKDYKKDRADAFKVIIENQNGKLYNDIVSEAESKVKVFLQQEDPSLIDKIVSPTVIESFYSCPYSSFIKNVLKVKEVDQGEMDSLSVGNIIHETFKEFVSSYKKGEISDKASLKNKVEEIIDKILSKQEYGKFYKDCVNEISLLRTKKEATDYCEKIFDDYQNSDFAPLYLEKPFGSGKEGSLEGIELFDGVKLKGVIDRIDGFNDYVRVVDYKTGKIDESNNSLFAGVKLQLYLYALAVGKNLAGLYYYPISGSYVKSEDQTGKQFFGKTLNDTEIIEKLDKNSHFGESKVLGTKYNKEKLNCPSKETLSGLIKYAKKMSENAVKEMKQGVIVPSPYSDACEYCSYAGMCKKQLKERNLSKISEEDIALSIDDKVNEISGKEID